MSSTPSPDDDDASEAADPKPRRLDERWWWSAALRMVVGGGVIAYQSGPIRDGSAFWLTWVMVGVGAVVAVRGAMVLWSTWKVEQQRQDPGTASDAS